MSHSHAAALRTDDVQSAGPDRSAGSLAGHVAAAKHLLERLEEQAVSALGTLERDGGAAFTDAVNERNRILRRLAEVVDAIAEDGQTKVGQPESLAPMLAEVARAAAGALESQHVLTAHAARERNRLAALLQNTNRPDAVAQQYAVASGSFPRRATLSVSG